MQIQNIFKIFSLFCNCRKYAGVRKWTLGLTGGGDQIAVIRASGSISRVRSPLSLSSSGIIGEQLIEKIRSVRGILGFVLSLPLIFLYVPFWVIDKYL